MSLTLVDLGQTTEARSELSFGRSRAKTSPAEVLDARTSGVFDSGMSIDFHRSEPVVFDLLERVSHDLEVDVSCPELVRRCSRRGARAAAPGRNR